MAVKALLTKPGMLSIRLLTGSTPTIMITNAMIA